MAVDGQTHVRGARRSSHHHGEAETAIYAVSGASEFVFLEPNPSTE